MLIITLLDILALDILGLHILGLDILGLDILGLHILGLDILGLYILEMTRIYAARSVLNFLGTSSITDNHVARDGGGIYTRDGSVVNLFGSSNYQGNVAGAAFQSSCKLAGKNTFKNNKAAEGGGLYTFNCTVNFLGENTFINY